MHPNGTQCLHILCGLGVGVLCFFPYFCSVSCVEVKAGTHFCILLDSASSGSNAWEFPTIGDPDIVP